MARPTRDEFKERMAKGKADKAAAKAAPPEPAESEPSPVMFVCNSIPALGLAVPSGLVSFDHGKLLLEDPRDIAWVRKHAWYGNRILEQEDRPEEDPAGTAADAPDAALGSSPPAASSLHSPFRRFLRQAEGGGFRCALCDMMSPYFPTEGAALNHLFHQHRNVTDAPAAALIKEG
jgi:hypothetical protein